jgi:uncharacterized membrane protein YgdD (TMEM256/DUF423 family)
MDMERLFVIVGSIIMIIGVGAGAFGAHALSSYFERHADLQSSFETAVRYLMIHGLAILAVAWASGRWPGALVNTAGYLFVAGIIIFSGSLFVLSLTGIRWLGAITPVGGVAFLAGWFFLMIAAWRSQ